MRIGIFGVDHTASNAALSALALLLAVAILLGCASSADAAQRRPVSYGQQEMMNLVVEEALRAQVPPELALAVAKVESDFRSDVVSEAGARGVMQIMPATALGDFGIEADALFTPRTNVRTGVQFLKQLMDRYGRTDIALSHYNGGSGVTRPDGRLRVLPATRDYVARVTALAREYRYHPQVLAARLEGATPASITRALDDFDVPLEEHASNRTASFRADALMADRRAALVDDLRAIRARVLRLRAARRVEVVYSPGDAAVARVAELHEW